MRTLMYVVLTVFVVTLSNGTAREYIKNCLFMFINMCYSLLRFFLFAIPQDFSIVLLKL